MIKSVKKTKGVHFKDEIKKSFFNYALIPTVILTLVIIVGSIAVWIIGLTQESKTSNDAICDVLNDTISSYSEKAMEFNTNSITQMSGDKGAISLVYSSLKAFVSGQKVNANFIILDKNFEIVTQGSSKGSFIVPDYQKGIEWGTLGRMKNNSNEVIVEVSKDYSNSNVYEIIVGKAVVIENNIDGYLVFTVTTQDLLDKLKNINTPFTITNEYYNAFTSTSLYYVNEFGKLTEDYVTNVNTIKSTSHEMIYRNDVSNGLLSVYTFVSINQLKVSIIAMVILTILMLVFIVIGMISSANKIAEQKTKIIDEIVLAYQSVQNGNLDNRLNIETNVEFMTIADSYNKMLDDIKSLIAENGKKTKEKYLSEIKQLEMQFNPHFLFNTLDTIKYMIKLKPDDAQETIVNLSEILRYSIDNEKSMVRLGDDIMYIENYLKILKARFNKHFVYDLDIKPETVKAVIPKLIIQPVIENAVKYGANEEGELNISISAVIKNEDLIITVRDSGVGMTNKEIAEIEKMIHSKNNDTGHIGLYNVQRRIELVFKNDYGITIKSKKDYGTTVKITMPYRNEEI